MGAFVISPLPPVLLEPLQTAGPLRSTGITPLLRYYGPLRHPLAFRRLPGVAGYTASLLRRFRGGTRRVSPVAQRVLVTVLSLSPRRSVSPRQPDCDDPCCLRPMIEGSASGAYHFRGHLCVHFRYGPMTRSPSFRMALSMGFRIRFPSSCYPSYRASGSYPGGTCLPLNTPAFAGHTNMPVHPAAPRIADLAH